MALPFLGKTSAGGALPRTRSGSRRASGSLSGGWIGRPPIVLLDLWRRCPTIYWYQLGALGVRRIPLVRSGLSFVWDSHETPSSKLKSDKLAHQSPFLPSAKRFEFRLSFSYRVAIMAKLIKFLEETLNQVSLFIQFLVTFTLRLTVTPGRYHCYRLNGLIAVILFLPIHNRLSFRPYSEACPAVSDNLTGFPGASTAARIAK